VRTLVIGGAASGKSAFAEAEVAAAAAERCPGPRYYIATLEPRAAEDRARIARHHRLRAARGFETLERYAGLAGLDLPARGAALLECVGTLLANELFSPAGAAYGYTACAPPQWARAAEAAERAVLEGASMLEGRCAELVVVTNDVFAGGGARALGEGTACYMGVLAAVNRALAARFERVVEVVCGIPLYLKG